MFPELRSLLSDLPQAIEAPPLPAEEIASRARAVLDGLRADLGRGQPVEVALTRSMARLQTLGMRLAEDDDRALTALTGALSEQIAIVQPHLPEGFEHAGAEMTDLFSAERMEALLGTPAQQAVAGGGLTEQVERVGQAANDWLEAQTPEVPAHITQCTSLLEVTTRRLVHLRLHEALDGDDAAEYQRISARYDDVVPLMRFATSEGQLLRHQRAGLRRVALDLARLERRRHLMVAYPDLPTGGVMLNPNLVFYSGTPAVHELVQQACARIRLGHPGRTGAGTRADDRWQQLRQAGIAVIDFSAYDPQRADPPGPVDPAAESDVLAAAGPVAAAAHDAGRAFVLGTPVVVLSRSTRPPPFDIAVDPVELTGDDGDVDRIVEHLQVAFYGVPFGSPGSSVEATVRHVRERYHGRGDPDVDALVDGLPDRLGDATAVGRILEAVAARVPERALLVRPVLPGSYAARTRTRAAPSCST
jgi:hypothetical protein